ncbi:MAG: hypothetical protein ACE148_10000 [Vicinamibacterales bacterium]
MAGTDGCRCVALRKTEPAVLTKVRVHAVFFACVGAASLLGALFPAGVRAERAPGQQERQPRFTERVDVARILVDARAVDETGQPIPGLTASDFRAKIRGREARVESATWVDGTPARAAAAGAVELPWAAPEPPGRLIVFMFQKDFEPSRMVGLMRMLIDTEKLLERFGPEDYLAVLSFDSHLKVWLDFTTDHEKVRQVLARGILFEKPKAVEPAGYPSLSRQLTQARARRAYTVEESLLLLGDALKGLPGAKSVVLVGHGFGFLAGSSIIFDRDYGPARYALQEARASVFCLDVTDADYHSLEAGLQMVAADTGGFFARTHIFPELALQRLVGALSGHYVLFIEVPDGLPEGFHEVELKLEGRRRGSVLARRHIIGSRS